jgi:cytochrome c553
MSRMTKSLIVTALLTCAAVAHAAGDPEAGREKAKACAGCHGMDGKGRIPLAGKRASYLAGQLRAYQSGARRSQMMNAIARQLNDQDIADLAAYYAAR